MTKTTSAPTSPAKSAKGSKKTTEAINLATAAKAVNNRELKYKYPAESSKEDRKKFRRNARATMIRLNKAITDAKSKEDKAKAQEELAKFTKHTYPTAK